MKIKLVGILDAALAEQVALNASEAIRRGGEPPIVDLHGVEAVLLEAAMIARARPVLQRCRWEGAPAEFVRQLNLLGVALDLAPLEHEGPLLSDDAADPLEAASAALGAWGDLGPSAGAEQVAILCENCHGPMKMGAGRVGHYACPHCGRRFYLDENAEQQPPRSRSRD